MLSRTYRSREWLSPRSQGVSKPSAVLKGFSHAGTYLLLVPQATVDPLAKPGKPSSLSCPDIFFAGGPFAMSGPNEKDSFAYSMLYSGTGAESIKDKYVPSGDIVGGTVGGSGASRLAAAHYSTSSNGKFRGPASGFVAPPTLWQDPGFQGHQSPTLAPSVPAHHTYYQTYRDPASLHPGTHSVYYRPTTQFTPSAGAPFHEVPPARFRATAQFPSSFVGMPGNTTGTIIVRGSGPACCATRRGDDGHHCPIGHAPPTLALGSGSVGHVPPTPAPSPVCTASSTSRSSTIKRNSASLDLTALSSGLGASRPSLGQASNVPPVNPHLRFHRYLSKTDEMSLARMHSPAKRHERSTEENWSVIESKVHQRSDREELAETGGNVSTSARELARAKLSPRAQRRSLQRYSESVTNAAREKCQELLRKASPSTAGSSPSGRTEVKKADERKGGETDTSRDRTPTKAGLDNADKEDIDEDDDYEHVRHENSPIKIPPAADDGRWTLVYIRTKMPKHS